MPVCADIGSIELADQCAFAREFCQLSSKIPYGTLYYCSSWPAVIRACVLVTTLMLIFAAMGVAAFDYMSPNLSTLAAQLGLSQTVMGVTVLAFANGSVDVFGAMVAINEGEGGMAVGEIMGGALFVSVVVVGSMAIITPFSIEEHNFKRDASFLTVAACLVMLIVYDNVVTLAEALLAVCLYAVYAVFVAYEHLAGRITVPVDGTVAEMDPEAGLPRLGSRQPSPFEGEDEIFTPVRASLYTAFDVNHRVSQQLHELSAAQHTQSPGSSVSDVSRRASAPDVITRPSSSQDVVPEILFSPPPPKPSRKRYLALEAHPHPHRPLSEETRVETQRLLSPQNLPKLQTAGLSLSPRTSASPLSTQSATADVMSRRSETSRMSAEPININELVYRVLEPQRIAAGMPSTEDPELRDEEEEGTHEQAMWRVLLPAFRDWSEMTTVYKLARLLLAPFLLLQSWSTPTASTAKSWEALCIYSVWVPLTCPFLAPRITYSARSLSAIAVAAVAGIVWWGRLRRDPPAVVVSASVGFMMGLLWVLFLATELVGVLQVLGAVFHVSNTIMGLTVFALGDSLGDFVSNMTVARVGYPAMAVAACYGGPIFTLLIGVGGSCIVAMMLNRKIELQLQVSRTVLLNGTGLVAVLAYVSVCLRASNWQINRALGVRMILLWFFIEIIMVGFFRNWD